MPASSPCVHHRTWTRRLVPTTRMQRRRRQGMRVVRWEAQRGRCLAPWKRATARTRSTWRGVRGCRASTRTSRTSSERAQARQVISAASRGVRVCNSAQQGHRPHSGRIRMLRCWLNANYASSSSPCHHYVTTQSAEVSVAHAQHALPCERASATTAWECRQRQRRPQLLLPARQRLARHHCCPHRCH